LRESLVAVKAAAEKAAALTKQMLAFSRRQVLRSQTVNLNDLLGNLMGILTRLIKENIELVMIPGERLGSVKADPNELERVILNLVVNAQDAMPGGGRLTIETSNVGPDDYPDREPHEFRRGDYVQVLVRDTGIGMDRETQARAFEPFFTTKEQHQGTGLGLSVVYGVVRQSGGHIRLESEPGVGTTFRIYLPSVLCAAEDAPSPPPWSLPRGTETILFAEDDPAIRGLLVPFLERLGYHVLSVPDGTAAIGAAQSFSGEIHLLLSDIVMPRMGGRELAKSLKANHHPKLKIVFISGYTGNQAVANDLLAEGASFLQKPFSLDVLAKTVRAALDNFQ
jgi:two-component system cell cycle sensor histidine kinase/response regulator CckA